MIYIVIQFALKCLIWLILSTILYNLFIIVKYFRNVKFAYGANAFYVPVLPFVGNAYAALLTGTEVNMLATVLLGEKYFGMPLNIWFGHKYHYMCNDAEEARIILNHPKCINKAQVYDVLQSIFADSLLLIPNEKWKPRRRYLRTAFKFNMIKSFNSTFYHQSCNLVDRIKIIQPNEDLYTYFNRFAFVNFFLIASGLDPEYIDPEIEKFGTLIDSIQDEFLTLLVNPIIPAFIWKKTPLGAKLRRLLREIKTFLKVSLLDKKQKLIESPEYVENPRDRLLIDLLLSDDYEEETPIDVFEEFTLFAVAATDTTGHTLAFCFTLLGMFPEIQQRLYDEVISVVGDRAIEHANIQDLKYTESVISETLRILPTVPVYGRYCEDDINLGTKIIPKGSNFFISAYHIHRNPKYWEDPLKFDPSRFFPENISKIMPGSYVPFSAGPRNCIGLGMATTLLKVTVANVIRSYSITSKHKSLDEFVLTSFFTMKTTNNLDCKFIPRIRNHN